MHLAMPCRILSEVYYVIANFGQVSHFSGTCFLTRVNNMIDKKRGGNLQWDTKTG